MRSNHTPPGQAARSVSRNVPVEWLDAGSWRLPSGKALAEFALQAGFLAPLLFRADRSGAKKSEAGKAPSPEASDRAGRADTALARQFDGKQFDKGASR
jgi:hypothetical protein